MLTDVSANPFLVQGAAGARAPQAWLFSREVDLGVFLGSALASFGLLALGALTGLLHAPLPTWAWFLLVVGVDVAHVWATIFRVYLDPRERARMASLAWGTPLCALIASAVLYQHSALSFWRAVSYFATFHFVRQQWGWIALYKRVQREKSSRLDDLLDQAAIYTATLYPLLYWHAHLPRAFHWLAPGDYVPFVPPWIASVLHVPHAVFLAGWLLRQWLRAHRREPVSVGKVIVVLTTWACWYVGIVALDSDFAFTVTNVLIHGVPYMALTWRYAKRRFGGARINPGARVAPRVLRYGIAGFLLVLLALAAVEELAWDQLVWHEHAYLFGDLGLRLPERLLALLVPLLAVPQLAHYALDGFVWRGGSTNPSLRDDLSLGRQTDSV